MSKKKKPTKYPPFGNYVQAVDYGKLEKRLETVLSKRAAESLNFDLFELDEACNTLRNDIKKLYRALAGAKKDAINLYDVSCAIWGDFEEFVYHIRSGRRGLDKLYFKSRNMPPLDKMSEDELTHRAMKPTLDLIAMCPHNAAKPLTHRAIKPALDFIAKNPAKAAKPAPGKTTRKARKK